MIDQALGVLNTFDWLTPIASLANQVIGDGAIMALPDEDFEYMLALRDAGYSVGHTYTVAGQWVFSLPRSQFEDEIDQLQAWGLDIEVLRQ